MLHRIRAFVPEWALNAYHFVLSWLAAAWYGHPSRSLVVVGVTGTNGKTTTSYLIAKALEATGDRTGCTTTALFKVGTDEWVNDTKMTMLGRFRLQKLLRRMVTAGCRYAVVETSSQGIVQHRHRHINYDLCVFTNLTPEHIEAHGGFENYKRAKIALFKHLAASKRKTLGGTRIPKTAVLNRMSEHAKDFAVPGLDRVVWFGIGDGEGVSAKDLRDEGWSVSFTVDGHRANINLPGEVNVENALGAIAAATSLGLPIEPVLKKISDVGGMPGRFERIDEGQAFTVVVDYAYEPAALGKLFDAVERRPHGRIIHVTGSAGGGRDVARRTIIGRLSAARADVTIVTNEDPYDEDPMRIIADVADAAAAAGKTEGTSLFRILDRAEAIRKAVSLAAPGDVVLLTGKGSEPVMAVAHGKKVPWDDRRAVRDALRDALNR